jgi:hypothetical protein
MSDTVAIVNRIVLRSIMPLFKVLHEEDDSLLRHILARFDGTIQLAVRGEDTGAHVVLGDRGLDVVQGIHPEPDLLLLFRHKKGMNALFTGGVPALAGIPRGLSHLGLAAKLVKLLLGLMILMPNVHPADPRRRELKVRMIMYMVTNALSQLNKGGDEEMAAWTAGQPDRIYQMSVAPAGPAAYLRVRHGRTKSGRGMYTRKSPFVHMKFNGIEGAYRVLAEAKDTVRATADGDIRLEGSPEYAGALGSFMVRIQDMLMPGGK